MTFWKRTIVLGKPGFAFIVSHTHLKIPTSRLQKGKYYLYIDTIYVYFFIFYIVINPQQSEAFLALCRRFINRFQSRSLSE
jgi:hypothetical protein